MRVTRSRIRFEPDELEGIATIDVLFDGRRIWSVPAARVKPSGLTWPRALRPYLKGRTEISVRDSADEREIGRSEVRFGWGNGRIDFRDQAGRPLAMTKWNRLGPVLDGESSGIRDRLLVNAAAIVETLEQHGFTTYIVGGSLLGAVRDGGLMPHDDDIDLAFLADSSDPADIALASYRMEHLLKDAGYVVVRHSLAHLEIDFFSPSGHVEHYVDVFTGFFRDGLYCQPFALRGPEVVPEDLVPVQRIEIEGVSLPAPANPEAWLSYAYGPDWRIPDPSFVFETSQWTRRRFEGSFGVYNRARVYWEKRYLGRDGRPDPVNADADLDRFLESIPPNSNVLDLGCGSGETSSLIAAAGHRVVGVDFSHEALAIARSSTDDARFHYLNLNDRSALLGFGLALVGSGERWYVHSRDVIHGLTRTNRKNVFTFLRLVLRGGAFAYFTTYTDFCREYRRGDPTSWHYPEDWILEESEGFGVTYRKVAAHRAATEHGRRNRLVFELRSADDVGHDEGTA